MVGQFENLWSERHLPLQDELADSRLVAQLAGVYGGPLLEQLRLEVRVGIILLSSDYVMKILPVWCPLGCPFFGLSNQPSWSLGRPTARSFFAGMTKDFDVLFDDIAIGTEPLGRREVRGLSATRLRSRIGGNRRAARQSD